MRENSQVQLWNSQYSAADGAAERRERLTFDRELRPFVDRLQLENTKLARLRR